MNYLFKFDKNSFAILIFNLIKTSIVELTNYYKSGSNVSGLYKKVAIGPCFLLYSGYKFLFFLLCNFSILNIFLVS
jgi:hypothetical protein